MLSLFLILILSHKINAQIVITSEILTAVFQITHGKQTGSCTIISFRDSDYLITAKHLFAESSLNHGDTVEIALRHQNGFQSLKAIYLIHINPLIDIAVLSLGTNNIKVNSFDIGNENYVLTQDAFFLGFPFGFGMEDGSGQMNQGYPIPFVKKGIISSFKSNQIRTIFLDGHNNPGFSGGPVVVKNYNIKKGEFNLRVIGVVSGYLYDKKQIETDNSLISYSENSGIVLAFGANYVLDILNAN